MVLGEGGGMKGMKMMILTLVNSIKCEIKGVVLYQWPCERTIIKQGAIPTDIYYPLGSNLS